MPCTRCPIRSCLQPTAHAQAAFLRQLQYTHGRKSSGGLTRPLLDVIGARCVDVDFASRGAIIVSSVLPLVFPLLALLWPSMTVEHASFKALPIPGVPIAFVISGCACAAATCLLRSFLYPWHSQPAARQTRSCNYAPPLAVRVPSSPLRSNAKLPQPLLSLCAGASSREFDRDQHPYPLHRKPSIAASSGQDERRGWRGGSGNMGRLMTVVTTVVNDGDNRSVARCLYARSRYCSRHLPPHFCGRWPADFPADFRSCKLWPCRLLCYRESTCLACMILLSMRDINSFFVERCTRKTLEKQCPMSMFECFRPLLTLLQKSRKVTPPPRKPLRPYLACSVNRSSRES